MIRNIFESYGAVMLVSSKEIAKRIRDTRKELNLTQQDLANELGRTSAAISDLERGKVRVNAVDLSKIACYLGKPIEFFYGEEFEGEDIQDLIALIRRMDPETREKLLITIQAMAEMQILSASIQSTDYTDEQELSKLAERFYSTLQPFLKNVGEIYSQGQELNSRLSNLFNR